MGPGMHHAQREGWRDMRINESTDKRIRQQGRLRKPALQIHGLKNFDLHLRGLTMTQRFGNKLLFQKMA